MNQHLPESRFAILTVCTGNICRSPLAEQLLRTRLDGSTNDPDFVIGSAGLQAVVGAPMDVDAARQLVALGGDPAGLVGAQLGEKHTDAADLILTMTRRQRDSVVRRFPRAMRRTFTLAEFAALSQAAAASEPRAIVEEAVRRRFSVKLRDIDDVPDPINASEEVHRAVATQIDRLVDTIVGALKPTQ